MQQSSLLNDGPPPYLDYCNDNKRKFINIIMPQALQNEYKILYVSITILQHAPELQIIIKHKQGKAKLKCKPRSVAGSFLLLKIVSAKL
jgi:hypothetical protein